MTNAELLKQDEISREKIKNEIDKNFFVEAGAGSGKTYSLVQRMVSMVKSGIDVSKISAITFTKAAAAEFYSRFHEELSKEAKNDTKCEKALKDIDLCFMGTIDSFCNMVLSEYPTQAKIPSDATVVSDEEMSSIYKREYSDIQKGKPPYGNELKLKASRFRKYVSYADEVFISLMNTLMEIKNSNIVFEKPFDKTIDEQYKTEIEALKNLLEYLYNHPEIFQEGSGPARSSKEALNENKNTLLGQWGKNLPKVISALKDIQNLRLLDTVDIDSLGVAASNIFEPHYNGNKVKWYNINPESDYWILDKLKNQQYSVALDFAVSCMQAISDKLRKEGKLTYFDYKLYLRDMLKEDASKDATLIKHIYNRHSYFLIDEFQDTNPIESEIFFYITAQNPQEDWTKCNPKPGSLFIVGDPKQSIYRFKSADVASFMRIKKMFENGVGEILYLTRNFRSTYEMNTWFNDVFTNLLPTDRENQSKFDKIPLLAKPKADDTLKGVYYYDTYSYKDVAESEKDAEKIADIIEGLVDNDKYYILEKENQDNPIKRKITYKDFMIITPSKTTLGKYIQALSKRNIKCKVEGKVLFEDCPALVKLISVFDAIAYPNEKKYQLGNTTEVEMIKNKGLPLNQFTSATLFKTIVECTDIYKNTDSKNMETLLYALELLRNAEASAEVTSLKNGSAFLHTLISGESGNERCLRLQKENNSVWIANLHKVKGLEAPIVILAAPSSSAKAPEMRTEHSDDEVKSWIFNVKRGYSLVLQTYAYNNEASKEEKELAAEKLRLLYVAATRARRVIFISRAKNKAGGDTNTNPWQFFVDNCKYDLFKKIQLGEKKEVEKEIVSVDDLIKEAKENNIFNDSTSSCESFEIKKPSQIHVKGKSSVEDDFEDVEDEKAQTSTGIVRKDANIIGTMVHKMMEVLVTSKNKVDIDKLVNEIINEYEYYDEVEARRILAEVGNVIRNGGYEQNNGAPKDILSELLDADEVYCEVTFCCEYEDENTEKKTFWNGIIDVVYAKEGKWHIVDYKTNADPKDLDEKYKEQLKAYTDSFTKMTGNDVDAIIYHINV